MIQKKIALFCSVLTFTFVFAQQNELRISMHSVDSVIVKSINYLQNNQRKESNSEVDNVCFKGEWRSEMGLRTSFFLLGKNKPVDDSNCFSVASIHNALARIYLLYPEYKQILPMLDLSYERILSYKNGNTFNFWNNLEPYRKLRRKSKKEEAQLVKRPSNYSLKSKYINNAANIADDADDTALSYTAIMLYSKIRKDSNRINGVYVVCSG